MKDIPGFEGKYAITKEGMVWSYPRRGTKLKGNWIKPVKHYKGYLQYYLATGKRSQRKIVMAHRLVALTYLPNPKNEKEINHKNGIKTDNRLENLEWSNRSDNLKHAVRLGLLKMPKQENHPRSKLNKLKVTEIRQKYKTGNYTQRQLAREYEVNQRNIWSIVHNETWVF